MGKYAIIWGNVIQDFVSLVKYTKKYKYGSTGGQPSCCLENTTVLYTDEKGPIRRIKQSDKSVALKTGNNFGHIRNGYGSHTNIIYFTSNNDEKAIEYLNKQKKSLKFKYPYYE